MEHPRSKPASLANTSEPHSPNYRPSNTTRSKLAWSTGFAFALTPGIAFAYIDPGSGGVIATAILGFFAAIGYTFRKYFYKTRQKLTGKKSPQDQDQED